MSITVSNRNNITSPDGNSLAVFKDATTGNIFVKDINGNVQNVDFTSTSSTLQQVLDAGNTATENMSVDGNINFGNANSFTTSSLKFVAGATNTVNGQDFIIGKANTSTGFTGTGGFIIGSSNTFGSASVPSEGVIIGFSNNLTTQSSTQKSIHIGQNITSVDGDNYLFGNTITTNLGNRFQSMIGYNITVPATSGFNNNGFGTFLEFTTNSGGNETIIGRFNSTNNPRNGYSPIFRIGVGNSGSAREDGISIIKQDASPNLNIVELKGRVEVSTGMVISPNPVNIQVDDSSLVIGAGNNDIVDGSDHCLAVGNGIQILDGSDQSMAVGTGSTISASNNSMILGRAGQIRNSVNSAIVGENNRIGNVGGVAMSRSMAIGSSHIIEGQSGGGRSLGFAFGFNHTLTNIQNNSMALGFGNSITTSHRNSIMVGGALTGVSETMTMGFRNNTGQYPSPDTANGLGLVKYAIAVGSTNNTNSNAILITEGGQGSLIPRIIMPTLLTLDFTSDTDAGNNGIPIGGLYHNTGQLFIRRT